MRDEVLRKEESSIRVALIPPVGYEEQAELGGIHMVLAPELSRDAYAEFYREQSGYIIMDNGTNEGCELTDEALHNCSEQLLPDEIVLPDVIGDREATQVRISRFLDLRSKKHDQRHTNYMGVLQGNTVTDVHNMIGWMLDKPIHTIGIPRHLPKTLARGVSFRVTLAQEIEKKYPGKFAIHFLGGIAEWPGEVRAMVKYAPFVRSMDTSLPFNYAIAGVQIKPVGNAVKRPFGYFVKYRLIDGPLLDYNVRTFLEWSRGIG